MRTMPASTRSIWALVLAIVLAMRLVTPAGFMPVVAHGQIAIVICDDGAGPPVHHHHGSVPGGHQHQPCPYSSMSSSGATSVPFAPILAVLGVLAALIPWIAAASLQMRRNYERPPLRGPPISA
jgi:hypothetical protein